MVRFSIKSNRVIPVGHGHSMPYFEALYGRILDVKLEGDTSLIRWRDGNPILIGDPVDSYVLDFKAAPNMVYDEILLLQQHQDSIPGLGVNEFVEIVDGSAYLLAEDGSDARPLNVGEFLPI
jgi:hypothetical protein